MIHNDIDCICVLVTKNLSISILPIESVIYTDALSCTREEYEYAFTDTFARIVEVSNVSWTKALCFQKH